MKVVERMLEFEEYKQKLTAIKPDLDLLRGALKLDAAEREIEELEAASAREGFWNDVEKSQKVQKRLKTLQNKRDNYNRLCGSWDDLMTLCEMAIEEGDDSLLEELQADFAAFEEKVEETRLSTLLTGEYDGNNAILTFHAGAGGTEAQDWASMLYRMYNMWADRHGYKVRVMDYLDGDEAGLKSATIMIEGENAYGFLKSEHGIHRLVRVSPFDAAGRRHTSFAAVEVMPEISDDTEIELRDEDIKMDVFRSSGLLRCRRTEGQQDLLGRAPDAYPDRDRGLQPGGAQPFPEPGKLQEHAAGAPRRDQGTRAPGEDQRHQGRADEDRMGQPDPLLRVHAVSAGEGPPHGL